MSQQINLLKPKDHSVGTAVWMGAGAGVLVLGLLACMQVVSSETRKLREAAKASEQKLAQVKGAIETAQRKNNVEAETAALKAEIAELKPRADAVGQLVKEVRSGGLGRPEGFANYYRTLAGLSQEGLWITSVVVSKGGTSVSIDGRALRNEAVMQYARRVNDAFAPYGVQFNSLELTPENIGKPGAPVNPGLATVAFKLS